MKAPGSKLAGKTGSTAGAAPPRRGARATSPRGRSWARRFSRLSIRLLAFNLLLVFLPLAAVSYLKTYEEQLLRSQEQSMVQQGRMVAAILGGRGEIDAELARQVFERLEQRTSARLQVLDHEALLLADTSTLGPRRQAPAGGERRTAGKGVEGSWLYRLGALPFRLWDHALDRLRPPAVEVPVDYYDARQPFRGIEIDKALLGEYGAATRLTGGEQRSVTLYSAIPIRDGREITGVVLVSQSTALILQDLYQIRLEIFKIFLATLLAAGLLTLLVSTTIARPIRRLGAEALSLLDTRGRLRGTFKKSERLDEIGDLTRSLRELARRLGEHQAMSESFAADLSHELKNPLASIRSANEVLAEIEDPADRRRFAATVAKSVARIERLLSTLREVTWIDARGAGNDLEHLALNPLVEEVVSGWRQSHEGSPSIELEMTPEPIVVEGSADHWAQVLENLLDNASSFSPRGQPIEVGLSSDNGLAQLTVRDHGPGIPEEHKSRVFQRFFSYRPNHGSSAGEHAGLGLAIVRAIVEAYGGTVAARRAAGGGAEFEVRWPRSKAGRGSSPEA